MSFVVVVWWWWIDRDQLAVQLFGVDRKNYNFSDIKASCKVLKCLVDQFTVNNETDPSWLYIQYRYNTCTCIFKLPELVVFLTSWYILTCKNIMFKILFIFDI